MSALDVLDARLTAVALASADALAVRAFDGELSYAELERKAEELAVLLRERGAAPGRLVGVCLSRNSSLVVALRAVWKTGAGYLPLDVDYPAERLDFMVSDARPVLLLVDGSSTVPPAGAPWLDVRDHSEGGSGPEPCWLAKETRYVIYTSGSTGKPKGVVIGEEALANFLDGWQALLGCGSGELVVASTSISFDIAVCELWTPLLAGSTILLLDQLTAADGASFVATLRAGQPDLIQATPTIWRLLLEAGLGALPGTKAVVGGEAFPPELAAELLKRGMKVWNAYGPTEATVWATAYQLRRGEEGAVPLGEPLPGYWVDVVGPALEPLPDDAEGELVIGGVSLADGYLQRPELTADRFVDTARGRAYRSGDLVRRSKGRLQYLGRLDTQIKHHGVRIEVGEIEAALCSHSSIAAAAVVLAGEADSRAPALVAYLKSTSDVPALELREHLLRSLPLPMLPDLFLFDADWPLTSNRKLDRRALAGRPLPAREASLAAGVLSAEAVPGTSPRSETERGIYEIWQKVLGVDEFSIEDDFLALGGQSIRAFAVVTQILKRYQVRLSAVRLFDHPTVAALATLVDSQRAG